MGGTPGAPPPPPWTLSPRDVINLKNAPTLGHSQAPPPPLDIARVTSSIWKTPPLLDIHKHPPLDIARVTSSIWKTPPLLDIHKHPPLDIARVTSSTYSKGGTKLLKGGTIIAKGWNKIAEGWNKIAKGWNKIFGMGNWGGVVRPPRPPPPGYGPGYRKFCFIESKTNVKNSLSAMDKRLSPPGQ